MTFLEFQVCRGCLATDTRMVDTRHHSASDFTRLVELLPSSRVGLPPCVCYECLAQLTKMRDFHAKNQRAYSVLMKIIQQKGQIEEADIKQIDRTQQSLTSPLKYHHTKTISIDPKLSYSDAAEDDVDEEIIPKLTEVKVEFKQEKKIKNEGCFDDFDDFSDDEPVKVKTSEIVLDNKTEKQNVKGTELKKAKTEKIKCRNLKNSIPKTRKRKKPTNNSELEPDGPEPQKVPRVRKPKQTNNKQIKQAPGTTPKIDPTKSFYTKDFHSFATLTIMTEEERLEFFNRRSEKQRYIDSDYKCTDCYIGFTSLDTYEKHRNKHDPILGEHICPLCKCRYKTQELQLKHVAMNHRTKFECKNCPFVCTNGQQARLHSKKHSSVTYRCEECNYISTHLASYKLHVTTMHGEETPCPFCGVAFLGLRAMRAHRIASHPKPSKGQSRLRCECRAFFYNYAARKLHRSTSSKHNPESSTLLSCVLCDSRFTDKQSLQAHMNTHPQEQKESVARSAMARDTRITCDQCGEAMTSRRTYRAHYRQVHPDKTIPANRATTSLPTVKYPDTLCDICGKTLKGKYSLIEHRFTHTGLRPFVCKICGKNFARRACFDSHMNTHTKQNVYKCGVCGRSFNNDSGRHRHMLVHTQEKLIPCDICGKSFKSRVHMLSHTKFVHMKKPWPKRDRSKRRLTQQQQYSDQESGSD